MYEIHFECECIHVKQIFQTKCAQKWNIWMTVSKKLLLSLWKKIVSRYLTWKFMIRLSSCLIQLFSLGFKNEYSDYGYWYCDVSWNLIIVCSYCKYISMQSLLYLNLKLVSIYLYCTWFTDLAIHVPYYSNCSITQPVINFLEVILGTGLDGDVKD